MEMDGSNILKTIIILTILLLSLSGTLFSIGVPVHALKKQQQDRFYVIHREKEEGTAWLIILVDKRTGNEYLWIKDGVRSGLTLLEKGSQNGR
jgi:hypothetical protein